MEEKIFCTLEMRNNRVFLDGTEIKGIERLNLLINSSSDLQPGKAELELKLIAEFPENTPKRNLLRAES